MSNVSWSCCRVAGVSLLSFRVANKRNWTGNSSIPACADDINDFFSFLCLYLTCHLHWFLTASCVWKQQHGRALLPVEQQHVVTSAELSAHPLHLCLFLPPRPSPRCRVRTACCSSSQPGPSQRSSATPSTPSACSTTCPTSSNGQGRNC